MLILDFVGVSANLDLISHETFLDEPDPAPDVDSFTEGEESADSSDGEEPEEDFGIEGPNINLRAIARGIESHTEHSYDEFNPFEASGVHYDRLELQGSEIGQNPPLSHKQYRLLCKYGIDDESLTKTEAQKLVGFIASKNFKLWAPELGVLRKLYQDILASRPIHEEVDFR
jgi:hypothetical protein